jgi:hypothetical protein
MGAQEAAALAMTEAQGGDADLPQDIEAAQVDDRAATDPPPASLAPPPADLEAGPPAQEGRDHYPPPAIRIPDEYLPEISREAPPGGGPAAPGATAPAARSGSVPQGNAASGAAAVSRTSSPTSADAAGRQARDDATDEVPVVRRPEPVRPVESDQEDLLRTTARLAVLMDDLDDRTGRDDDRRAP